MLDLKYITQHVEEIRVHLDHLGEPGAPLDRILELDVQRRTVVKEADELRSERKSVSKRIGRMEDGPERQGLMDSMRCVSERVDELETRSRQIEQALRDAMLRMPNMPDPDVPVGGGEEENVLVRTVGNRPSFSYEPLPHWDVGERLGIIDFERGVKLAGSRFYVLMGQGARLQRALISWMIDLHVNEHGYKEVYPPFMVRGECMVGTGQLPKFGDNLYRDAEEDYYWIPTAEVPVTNMYANEILDEKDLPIYHTAYTACFRREKMSAGKDVRGMKRGHQFDKVEMVKFVNPQTSNEELLSLLNDAEDVCEGLEIPYRIVQMCTGDLSFTACKKFDVEVWAPGCQEWLEVSSCSNFRDFQARRANIRFRPTQGGKPEFVHTLNGSGLALPRVMIALIEHNQNEDGSVTVPSVLRPYMGGLESITRV